ncbi:ATP-NAD kinase family protein [Schnuerera ultunensis]|uniref:ATP-NAD kinase family protein n=1 Tax=Schnuerera ultunensis TaxID=45497 RepID=UPI00040E8D15|nr:ATP-NAD kinase family protein [Schnuerera ultunensis]
MKKIGLIVNPIAGMGGKVGLKGTDGIHILNKAVRLGATPEAPAKTLKALKKLLPVRDRLVIVTCSGNMGQEEAENMGFRTNIVYSSKEPITNSNDTKLGAKKIEEEGVDLLIFVGGDGTARDLYESVGNKQLVLGIPAGVKIHSPVYANTPEKAGELALLYVTGKNMVVREEEVVDIDEEAFRKDMVRTQLYGYLKVPVDKKFMQNKKAPTPLNEETTQKAIALDIVDHMDKDTCYIIGPGTTTRAIMQALSLPYTLLGVDVVMNRKLIKKDVSERDLLNYVNQYPSKLILTPTGGQGYLLGRGNQQISGEVVKKIGKENIIIVSTNSKIIELRGKPLLVYTGDEKVDQMLKGYYRVKVGYGMEMMYGVETG